MVSAHPGGSPSPGIDAGRALAPLETRRGRWDVVPWLVDAVYLTALVFALPYLVVTRRGGRVIDHWRRRTGRVERRSSDRPCVWIHGVSVGEILSARGILAQLESEFPDWEIVLSTTTRAGLAAARRHYPHHRVISYPFDFSFLVRRAFRRIRPNLVVIVEHELWPNFLRLAGSRGVPVVLVNARLSERSRQGYRWLSRIFRWPPRSVVHICAEDETSARGFEELGVERERVTVTGNLKFDSSSAAGVCTRRELGLSPENWTFVAGSTHHGEEDIVIESFCKLREEDSRARLVLAPRRTDRTSEISRAIRRRGLRPVLWSKLARSNRAIRQSRTNGTVLDSPPGAPAAPLNGHASASFQPLSLAADEVLLVDTVGDLPRIAGSGDVVFVGGSLIPFGGHNVIEPARHGCPVLIGPHYGSFRQIVSSFLADRAMLVVQDRNELLARLRDLRSNPDKAQGMGARARATVARNVGASARTFAALHPIVAELTRRAALEESSHEEREGDAKKDEEERKSREPELEV